MPAIDRRQFLAQSIAATSAAALASTTGVGGLLAPSPAHAATGHVVVLGGGCAGLSAAHELVERGFSVDVYERYPVPGGKCRSIPVEGTGTAGRADLPGEHGFRFFPGYYRHVVDTMARIPYGSNPHGVKDNLTVGETVRYSRQDALDIPVPFKKLYRVSPITDLPAAIVGLLGLVPGISSVEMSYFGTRMTEFATACTARRDNEYDHLSWWDFVRADDFGQTYRDFVVRAGTRHLIAAQACARAARPAGSAPTRTCSRSPSRPPGHSSGPNTAPWTRAWRPSTACRSSG